MNKTTQKKGGGKKHTSIIWVPVDYLQEGNFGKSWFPEASFGWWAAVRQHVVLSMYCQSTYYYYYNQTTTDNRYTMSYISLWRTGQGLYSESDPPSLCLLKPLVSPESKWEKSQNSCCWNLSTDIFSLISVTMKTTPQYSAMTTIMQGWCMGRGNWAIVCFVDQVDWGRQKQVPMLWWGSMLCFLKTDVWFLHKMKFGMF